MSQNTPLPNQPYNAAYDDGINLFELFQSIWQEKILVVAITAVITVLALIYALMATPVYQVQSIIKSASIKDLDQLNGIEINMLSPAEALIQVGASLESYETRLGYFNANQDLLEPMLSKSKSAEQNFERLNRESIKINVKKDVEKDKNFAGYVSIQMQYPKGINGAVFLNGFVEHVIAVEKQLVADSLETLINNRLELLARTMDSARVGYDASKEAQIAQLAEKDALKKAELIDELAALREELKVRRQNRIMQLDEAIAIAKSLGITKPATRSSLAEGQHRAASSVIRTEVNNEETPLFFMGTDALNAERNSLMARENDDFTSDRIVEINTALKILEYNRQIEILQSRENDELFLVELADNRKKMSNLKSLQVNMDSLKLVRIDQSAIEPTSPIKPKKSLIVILGIVLGGTLGVLAALIRSNIRKGKNARAQ